MKTTRKQTPLPEPDPEPPEHLSERSQRLWRDLIHRARPTSRQVLLQAALEALDRSEEARALVARQGLTTTTAGTGAVHVHPAARVEREAKAQFLNIWVALGLETARNYTKDFVGESLWKTN